MPPRESRSLPSGNLRAPLDLRFEQADQPDNPPSALDPRLAPMYSGVARVERRARTLRLTVGPATAPIYCNAQLDDYHRLRSREYPWRPPLLLRVRARASRPTWHAGAPLDEDAGHLRGTAGFGFWNASLTLAGGLPRPPEAVWFFAASPPSNMALTPGVPGYGWKAQVVHVQRPGALAAIPPMAAAALWANVSGDEQPAARWLNRLTGARETLLDPLVASLGDWHDYEIEWRPDAARFRVDGREVLTVPAPPRGPLGFVVWIDSQYAIATPRGRLRFGALDIDEQWLELALLSIQPL